MARDKKLIGSIMGLIAWTALAFWGTSQIIPDSEKTNPDAITTSFFIAADWLLGALAILQEPFLKIDPGDK